MSDPNKHIGFERPSTPPGDICVTPIDATMVQLLGGQTFDGVTFTTDQIRALERFYGFDFKQAGDEAEAHAQEAHEAALEAHQAFMDDPDVIYWKKEEKEPPTAPDVKSIRNFIVAGSYRNMMRAVKEDGLRVMGFLARFLEKGQDPVKLLVQLMSESGFDVSDCEWAFEEESDA